MWDVFGSAIDSGRASRPLGRPDCCGRTGVRNIVSLCSWLDDRRCGRCRRSVRRRCRAPRLPLVAETKTQDRKSTRLNSSHSQISYAVFCLKKKTKHNDLLNLTASLPRELVHNLMLDGVGYRTVAIILLSHCLRYSRCTGCHEASESFTEMT